MVFSAPSPSLTALSGDLAQDHPEPFAGLRRDLLTVLEAGLDAVQPGPLLEACLDDGRLRVDGNAYDLGQGEGVHVLAAGRGSEGFAVVAHGALPEAEGLVIAPRDRELPGWEWIQGEHPVPGPGSLEAGQAALEFVERIGQDETLLVLLTGGASALMENPRIPLEDLQLLTNTMLARGLTIHETNMLRKHLSRIKGGQLGAACDGSVITLAISDVPYDRASDIGSGPTVPDPTTFAQAHALIQRLGEENVPPVVVERILQGTQGKIPETPKPESQEIQGNIHLLATNKDALRSADEMARELGHRAFTLPSLMEGEARVVGESLAKRLVREGNALIAGGETIVNLRPVHQGGPGEGGRNQELALATVRALAGEPAVAAAFGTDGIDGPTDAAGAIVDGRTLERATQQGLDADNHLARNDSHSFFDPLGDLIRTGPTGTNAMDMFVGLVHEE